MKLFWRDLIRAAATPKPNYVWALCRDDRRWKGNSNPGVVFHFKQSRHGKRAEEILEGFSGTLQVNGYSGCNRLASKDRDGGPITLAYCWAHVRRKFLDVVKATKSEEAQRILDLIGQIYGIEQEMQKPSPISAAARRSIRQNESLPLIDRLFRILRDLSRKISMKSTLGSAIRYTMKLMDGLQVFLSDGRVEFDSNAVENTIRPIAVLRKNALFSGSEIGGRNWAVMASIIGTCRVNGVEPYA
ncbi:IS66 family transposase [Ruegeria sp. ANG-R]|uniref:IS66 family transposase n=1 Tax=Ruegeria sp. ANG-R TaxID=1577903 RepID=UPI0009E37391|nr:IS66 family transposase [Ruegeria sp. ANG-R]